MASSAHLAGEFVAGVGAEPAVDVQSLRGGVPVPAVLAGEDHFHDVVAKVAELLDEFGQRQELVLAGGVAALAGGLVGRVLAPVGFVDQHHPVGLQAVPEELERPGAVADPGGADASGDAGRLTGHIARRATVHEADLIVYAQLGGRARAAAMNTAQMSIPVSVIWWSRAQVQSISPVPRTRSSIRVPGGGLSAGPKVASLSLVNVLWMRWLLSRMV